jgi:hypothetical protein
MFLLVYISCTWGLVVTFLTPFITLPYPFPLPHIVQQFSVYFIVSYLYTDEMYFNSMILKKGNLKHSHLMLLVKTCFITVSNIQFH